MTKSLSYTLHASVPSSHHITHTTMADDTRQSREDLSRSALNVSPENKPFAGTQWQDGATQPYTAPANANMMPGGTAHTAGGEKLEGSVTLGSALDSIKLEEFTTIHKKPCVRDSFLTGIGSGAGIGGLRFLFGGSSRLFLSIQHSLADDMRHSGHMVRLQLGRRLLGTRLFRHVSVLQSPAAARKRGHDARGGDIE